ncbi:MAG: dockerin type I domain-containing protein [Planctomycetota bacterium]|nr:dockerin type I domain-containing protein [Planctomycetota bacterium]
MRIRKHVIAALALGGLASTHAWSQPAFDPAVVVGSLNSDQITEASGLGASQRNPGVLWTHNDSGDSARVFAIDTMGRLLATYNLPGVLALDFEDMCMGPAPGGAWYVYVGDIGDNLAFRPSIAVHRFVEPAVSLSQWTAPTTQDAVGRESITLLYPDGAKNAEGLAIDPATGDLFVFTKQSGTTRVYRGEAAALVNGATVTMSLVATFPLNLATAADIAPDGSLIIAKNLTSALVWSRSPGQTVGQAMSIAGTPAPVLVGERQGEAVTFAHDLSGYYGVGERLNAQVWFCARVISCDPDMNGDGNVDQDDIECLVQAISGTPACLAPGADADFTGDGNVDQGDVEALQQVVGGQPCP